MSNDYANKFLNRFKDLEEKLVSLSNLKGGYIGYSRALDECRKRQKIPLLKSNDIYQFLRTASDLRNILSHQNNVCIPTEGFYKKFDDIAEEIINPLDAYDICVPKNKIVYAQLGSNVNDIIEMMIESHLSHVPVMEKGRVIGVFSQSTFFQYAYLHKSLKLDDTFTIRDFINVGEYNGINDNFLFVDRNLKAYKLVQYLYKKNPSEKRTSVLFITEHGKPDEELLGLITPVDILKISLYKENI